MNAKARRKTQKSAFYGAPTKDADHRRRNGEGHPAVCLRALALVANSRAPARTGSVYLYLMSILYHPRSRAYGEGILRCARQRALALAANSRASARTGSAVIG